jgi:uncharacterized protein (DUF1015 family)
LPEIQAFPGIRYQGVPLQDVLCPPYDVITPAEQKRLLARHPRNIVRVVLNPAPGELGYAEAGRCFADWRKDGTLRADDAPALYALEQRFAVEGRALKRLGLLARFRAEDAGGSVLPHEQTRQAAKQDRWRVLTATSANFSPIFSMLDDPTHAVTEALQRAVSGTPLAEYADDDGVGHRLFRISEAPAIAGLRDGFARTTAYIADGHHRYATALRYRDERGPDGAWTLGYFTPLDDPGLLVLPYHRILSNGPTLDEARAKLEGRFLLNVVGGVARAARDCGQSTMPYAFALAWPDGRALVAEALPEVEDLFAPETPASLAALDTYFFHEVVLAKLFGVAPESVGYVHSLHEAEAAVGSGGCRLTALMRGTPVRQIVAVAEARQSMPAKSTFFHPKLPSGLLIHPLVV